MPIWIRTALAVSLVIICLPSVEAAAALKPYVLFPVTTALQRKLSMSNSATAYAMLDVKALLEDGRFDVARLEQAGFSLDLAELRARQVAANSNLMLVFRFADVRLGEEETKTMEQAVEKLCRAAGFKRVSVGGRYEGVSWQEKLAKFAPVVEEADPSESPVEDELVRVYPVRTGFSRFLLDDGAYDCVVRLRQPIDGRFQGLTAATRGSITAHIAELKLPRRRRLMWDLSTTKPGREVAEQYFGGQFGVLSPRLPLEVASISVRDRPWVNEWLQDRVFSRALPMLNELGFESSAYTQSTSFVSPERLLGKPAPDFTLPALAGGEIQLHDAIRGRVAVVTFWGVACAPCRAEAPHLNALAKQFTAGDLVVVAVNAYDESKDVVAQFARSKGISYPIALMGRKMGEEKYTVASYPQTFLLDHRGVVVDYLLGFEEGDEKHLTEAVVRLLQQRKVASEKQ
jgi:thiol-disulfide isomerase/thioredoxin